MAADPNGGLSLPEFVVGLVLNMLALVTGGAWKIRTYVAAERKEIDHAIAGMENELSDRIAGVESNARQSLESAQRMHDRTVDAIKQAVHEHVLYVERNFARRDSFVKVTDDMKRDIREGFDQVYQRLDTLGRHK